MGAVSERDPAPLNFGEQTLIRGGLPKELQALDDAARPVGIVLRLTTIDGAPLSKADHDEWLAALDLGLAWAAAEAALPLLSDGTRGGVSLNLKRNSGRGYDARTFVAGGLSSFRHATLSRFALSAKADTPAEALRALAEKLRDAQ